MIGGQLAKRAEQLAGDRTPFVVATVVRARRPTSARPGDAALVLPDGTIDGFVGGACASSSVRLHALRVLETGEPLLLWIVPDDALLAPGDELGGSERAVVFERNPCLSGGSLEIFLEPQLPAPRLAIVGSSPIAEALAGVAGAVGYDVVPAVGELPADSTALVVASHGAGEEQALEAALEAGVPYVALVASGNRGAAVRASLDVPHELHTRLHTPAGLDIGARTPQEIAVAIVAELIAERRSSAHLTAPVPAEEAIDPVCGMKVAVSESTPYLDRPQGRVFFCSEGCRRSYAEQHATAR